MTQSTPEDESWKLVYVVAWYYVYFSCLSLTIPVAGAQIHKPANNKDRGSEKLDAMLNKELPSDHTGNFLILTL